MTAPAECEAIAALRLSLARHKAHLDPATGERREGRTRERHVPTMALAGLPALIEAAHRGEVELDPGKPRGR